MFLILAPWPLDYYGKYWFKGFMGGTMRGCILF
jgi:hypothetical protein